MITAENTSQLYNLYLYFIYFLELNFVRMQSEVTGCVVLSFACSVFRLLRSMLKGSW